MHLRNISLVALLSAAPWLVACGGSGDTANDTVEGQAGAASGAAGKAGGGQAGAGGTKAGAGGGGAGGAAGKAGSSGAGAGGGQAGLCTPDADGDNLTDELEGKATSVDTDGDGVPDWQDPDSDGDGVPDLLEGQTASNGCASPQDSDGDKIPDYRDLDSDGNGLPDAKEVYPSGLPYDGKTPPADTDGDHYPDYADPDNDNDSLPDTVELVNGVAVDTDKDGLPDLDDPDSDDDTIADGMDGAADADGDGIPNFRDLDSDNDGIPDLCEAGPNHKLQDLPIDTDKDGKADFLDIDSDNDGLLDKDEDKNGNCKVDPGETDPRKADTDGDGASDLIELALGSNPNDADETPQSLGKFFFVMPYKQPPQPASAVMAIGTKLQKADVAFVMDTTGSMGPSIAALQGGIQSMISQLAVEIPDVGVAVAAHDDFPVTPYGNPGVSPFYVATSGKLTTDPLVAKQAVNSLTTHDGGDTPESQVLAFWASITNTTYAYPGLIVQKDNNIPSTRFGRLALRNDALPILVSVTDAPFHNGRRVNDPSTLHDPYSFNGQAPYPTPTVDTLVKEMSDIGVKFIGIAVNDGVRSADPYYDMAYLAEKTGSLVPPQAFGGSACKTALAGTLPPDATDGKSCRLVFDAYKSGSGLSTHVVDGVRALLRAIRLDVRVVAVSDEPDASNGFVDSVDEFVDHIEVRLAGGDDPTNPGESCVVLNESQTLDAWDGPKGIVLGGDSYWDTVKAVTPTTRICFEIVPTQNKTVPSAKAAQVFHAVLQVRAKVGKLGEVDFGAPRDVLFVVPPSAQ